jgi:Protein of unknown function (DUF2865)
LAPVAARAALLLREQLRGPGGLQLSNLGVERLPVSRDPAIADDLGHRQFWQARQCRMGRVPKGSSIFCLVASSGFPPPDAQPPTPTVGRVAPPALGQESVSGNSSIGRSVGFCVRVCDGQHSPIGQIVYGTPKDTCTAICPYSKTKLFFGSEIRSASAKDGQRYFELESAFLYRKELVANCTCNGRDPFGLAPLGVKNDPTLRPGDLVSTAKGLMAFGGKSAQGDAFFTPVDPTMLPTNLRPPPSQFALPPTTEPTRETMPGPNAPTGDR